MMATSGPRSVRLSNDPVDRSSKTTTLLPAAARKRTRFEPMKPAPPVTRTVIEGSLLRTVGAIPSPAHRPRDVYQLKRVTYGGLAGPEPADGLGQALFERGGRLPPEKIARAGDVRATHPRIVCGKRSVLDRRGRVGQCSNQLGEVEDGAFVRVAEVD